MYKEKSFSPRGLSSQLVIGFGVVLLGVLLLFDQFNIFSVGTIMQFFPLLFIALGFWQLISNGFRHWVGPTIMIGIMSVLQLSILDMVDGSFLWRLWPLVLIAVGASMLLRQRGGDVVAEGDSTDSFDILTIFSGAERRFSSHAFHGGNITVVFGGAEVDLTEIQVTERPATIHLFVLFGGVELKFSPDTLVNNQLVAIFGGSEDSRKQRKSLAGEQAEVAIKGFVMFGGVEVSG